MTEQTASHVIERDTWLYRGGESRMFRAGEDRPGSEWRDEPDVHPDEAPPATPLAGGDNDLAAELIALTDQVNALEDQIRPLGRALIDEFAVEPEEGDTPCQAAVRVMRGQASKISSLESELEAAKAAIAKFDADGDGKPGGSKKAAGQ
jgi:hypothetical protein